MSKDCENCRKLQKEIDELQKLIDRMPKDAEGNPCLPGDIRYHPDERPKGYVKYDDCWKGDFDEGVEFCYEWNSKYVEKYSPTGTPWSYRPISECYSSKEAAEEAKKYRDFQQKLDERKADDEKSRI